MQCLQPISEREGLRASELELMCARFVTVVKMRPGEIARAMLLTKSLPLKLQRRRHLVKAVTKLYRRTHGDHGTRRSHENWKVLLTYSTVAPLVRNAQISSEPDDLGKCQKNQLGKLKMEAATGANKCMCKIPERHDLPSVYRAGIRGHLERVETLWYVNRIPASATLSVVRLILATLLEEKKLENDKLEVITERLSQVLLTGSESSHDMQKLKNMQGATEYAS